MKVTIEKESSEPRESKLKPLMDFLRSLGDTSIEQVRDAILIVSVFVLPLFFGLGGVGNVEFSKQIFVVVAGWLVLMAWFLSGLFQNKIEFKPSITHILAGVFILFLIVSTALSVWRWGSFWGYPQQVKENLLTYLSLFVLYVAVTQIIDFKKAKWVSKALTISLLIVTVFGGLQFLGKFVVPFFFTKTRAFNTIGSVNQWALFLASLTPLALAMSALAKEKICKIVYYITSILLIAGIFLVSFKMAWIALLVGVSIYMTIVLWKSQGGDYKLLFLPALFFALAMGFGLLNIQLPTMSSPTVEVRPTLKATFDISLEMLKDSAKTWIVGWGPGTFKYGWSRFRDPSLNQTLFWNTRFTRGGSDITDKIGTIGLPGFVAYVSILLSGVVMAIIYFLRDRLEVDESEWLLMAGLLGSFTSLSVTKFITTHNTTLEFVWWLLLGLIVGLTAKNKKEYLLSAESKASFLLSFTGIMVITGSIFLFYLTGTRYVAEIKYAKAFVAESREEAGSLMTQAINLNPDQESFWRGVADYYVGQANVELNSDKSKEDKTQLVSQYIGNAVTAANRATVINPSNVANWQSRGKVYQQIIGLSSGSFDWALKSYDKALILEPNNPYLMVEKGITYMRQASVVDEGKDTYFDKAEEQLRKALEIKPDYSSATYQMSLLYQMRGQVDRAIETLESLKRMGSYLSGYDPMNDVGLAFQLGVLYYNEGNTGSAISEFERAVKINPNYSNARYFLGLAYDEQGRVGDALEQFEALVEINPDNEQVKEILDNIRSGKPALGGQEVPDETPIKEEPSEE